MKIEEIKDNILIFSLNFEQNENIFDSKFSVSKKVLNEFKSEKDNQNNIQIKSNLKNVLKIKEILSSDNFKSVILEYLYAYHIKKDFNENLKINYIDDDFNLNFFDGVISNISNIYITFNKPIFKIDINKINNKIIELHKPCNLKMQRLNKIKNVTLKYNILGKSGIYVEQKIIAPNNINIDYIKNIDLMKKNKSIFSVIIEDNEFIIEGKTFFNWNELI